MDMIVVIGGGALTLLGLLILISECLQVDGDSSKGP